MFSLMGKIGDKLSSIGEDESAVKDYFTSYAQPQYTSIVEFLSTWTGQTYPTSSAAALATPAPPPIASPTPTPAPSQVNQACYSGNPQGPYPQASFARSDAISVISSVCASDSSNVILGSGTLPTGGVSVNLGASQEDPNAPAFSLDTCVYGFGAAMDNCDTNTVDGKFGGTVTIGGIDYQIFADVPPTH